jgi:hypothetical protein
MGLNHSRTAMHYPGPLERIRRPRAPAWRYDQIVLADAPISYWRLDETAGTAAADRMGANGGTYTGTYTLGAPGALAGDLSAGVGLDGSTAYVAVGTFTGLPVGANVRTIEAWINISGVGGTVFAYGNGATAGQEFIVSAVNVAGTWYLFTDATNASNNLTLTGAEIPSAGVWHHIAFVLSSSTAWAYYLDGQFVKSGTFAVAINTATVNAARIGDRADVAGQTFAGVLDEVAVYAAALPASRIWEHYRAGVRRG